jgi:hypothetical protein
MDTAGVGSDIAEDLGLGRGLTDAEAITAICEALISGEVDFGEYVNTPAPHASDLPLGTQSG